CVQSRAGDLRYANDLSGVSVPLNGVTYGGDSKFVAVGTSSTALSSSLGTTAWTVASFPTAGLNLTAVAYGNGMFVAGATNKVFSSTDAMNWTSRGNAFFSVGIAGLAFSSGSDGTFVAVARALAISWADANLAAWHQATINAGGFIE